MNERGYAIYTVKRRLNTIVHGVEFHSVSKVTYRKIRSLRVRRLAISIKKDNCYD